LRKERLEQLIDRDLPPVGPITEETRELAMQASRWVRGSVRVSLGMIWTEREFEAYRKAVLATDLP
jgi:hypothetical protein